MTKEIELFKLLFFLGIFFNENNNTKLAFDNALSEKNCWNCWKRLLIIIQVGSNEHDFFIHLTVFATKWTSRNQFLFFLLTILFADFKRDGYLHSCVNKRAVESNLFHRVFFLENRYFLKETCVHKRTKDKECYPNIVQWYRARQKVLR